MKVLQTIPYMLASQGGPSTCTCDLLQGLHEVGAQVDLLTAVCGNPADRNLGAGSPWLKEVAMDYRTPLALSASTQAFLERSDYDIYHANTLWLHPVHATCRHARKVGKPYVLSTHGMLYPTALAVSGWKKKLMGALWYKEDIMKATCLHATCMAEMEHNRKYGYKGPIAVIPNAVVFPDFLIEDKKGFAEKAFGEKAVLTKTEKTAEVSSDSASLSLSEQSSEIESKLSSSAACSANGVGTNTDDSSAKNSKNQFTENLREIHDNSRLERKKTIGFLGRLHPIKKVENVLYALSHISEDTRKGISFQIMGKFDDQYEQWLKDEVKRLKLEDCVEFVGFVSGKEKYDRLSKLSALMVPSAQENFGMIVPEALICGMPVYASLGTPWSELNEYNAGWWHDNSPETISKVILDILSKSDEELRAMGANGRKLMEEKYEQHKVAQMMVDLYKWINGEGPKPEFVYE